MPLSGSAFWAVILPVEKTNLLRNPSLEANATGWSDTGVGAGRASDVQAFGAWCYQMPVSGGTLPLAVGTWTAGVGTAYTASIYMRLEAGQTARFGVRTTGNYLTGAWLGSIVITPGGTWHRYSVAYTEASGGGDRFLMSYVETASLTTTFSVDGAQVEVGSLTTYIDGDQDGCYWRGIPHASQSVRSGTYRGGGSVVALEDLGLKPDQQLGIGMPPLENTRQSFALQDGAEFQRQRARERPFSLTCKPLMGTSLRDYHVVRRTLIDALKIDLVSPQQPARLWYTGGQGTVAIDAVLDAGLDGGQMEGPIAENVAIRFVADNPFWYATTDQGTALASRTSIGSTNFIAWRDPLGRWGTTGSNGTAVNLSSGGEAINDLLFYNGTLFVAGNFGTAGGTQARQVAMYRPDNNSWGTLAGGTLAAVTNYALALSPTGDLYVGGDFTTAAGTRCVGVARWNGAWGTLIGGTIAAGANVHDLLYSPTGTLFVGGDFLTVQGSTAPRVAMWTGAAWGTLTGGTLGGGLGIVYALAMDAPGNLYIGGDITLAGGSNAIGIARWRGAFGTLGAGMQSALGTIVYALAVGANGVLYAGGNFGSAGGGSAQNIAQWTGVQWFPMAQGIGTNTGGVFALVPTPDGALFVGGRNWPNGAGGRPMPDEAAMWNGYTFLPLDVDVGAGGGGTVRGVFDPSGTLWIAGGFSGTARAASVAAIYNTGRTDAAPVCVMRNPSAGTARVYQLVNTLTGDGIFFDLVLLSGETVTLDLTQDSRTLTSSFRGNIFSTILPGSNLSAFSLLSSTNYVSFFADNDSLATSIYWRPRHWSADGGTVL